MASDDDIFFLDGEAIDRILAAPLDGGLCTKIRQLASQGKLCCCRTCFNGAVASNASPASQEVVHWGILLIDDGELVDIECGRLISNLNPAYTRRPEVYRQKLTVIAKSRLEHCTLVTDDTGLSSSSMTKICDKMNLPYETFDDLFGNLN